MVFSYLGVLKILNWVDVEFFGNLFNYLFFLELEEGILRNFFINSGVIVIVDILVLELKNLKEDFL